MEWVVATSQWKMERLARGNLASQGFTSYFPKFKETAVVNGHKIVRDGLLFGRYFFVSFLDSWRSITGTRGVASLLMATPETPSRVPDSVVNEIRSREVDGFVMLGMDRFRKGQRVRVLSGQFENQFGIYDGMGRKDREIAFLNVFGRLTRVELAASDLVAA